ncbi:MAG: glutathione S-transferase family protein [Marinobacter sp.]|uniref:glutathione S-transferase family protein n=1 Tax=Marinobacter sp. TaxID=50741 RepID=UPI00299DD0ED|nr:glutathione S-transferase family protein [Marinobacter sp.]MDX1756416.1 glutathione S-transferase family protein [Marinobacter sp.]
MAVKLYQFAISHYCEKARWALDYKGIQYQPVNLLPGQHIKVVKQLADQSSVPVLVHDDRVVQGSAAIIDYLDKAFPEPPLTPTDPETRQRVLEWERRLDKVAGPAVRCYCYHYLLQRPKLVAPMLAAQTPFYNRYLIRLGFSRIEELMRKFMKINEQTARSSQDAMEQVLKELTKAYQQSDYLVGDRFSRADLTAAALFAPLFQPESYPVPWPTMEKLPEPMRDWVTGQQPELLPLQRVYQQHRAARS